jgi:hypothetical protein
VSQGHTLATEQQTVCSGQQTPWLGGETLPSRMQ